MEVANLMHEQTAPRLCLGCAESATPTRWFCELCLATLPRHERRRLYAARWYQQRRLRGVVATPTTTLDQRRVYSDRYLYGLEPDARQRLLDEQGGGCAICGTKSERLLVDHDHETRTVRGLLCLNCNTGLGMVSDNTARLRALLSYLEAASV